MKKNRTTQPVGEQKITASQPRECIGEPAECLRGTLVTQSAFMNSSVIQYCCFYLKEKAAALGIFSSCRGINTSLRGVQPRQKGYKELEGLIVASISLLQEAKDLLVHARANESKNHKTKISNGEEILNKLGKGNN